jgi:hypothetical protein
MSPSDAMVVVMFSPLILGNICENKLSEDVVDVAVGIGD